MPHRYFIVDAFADRPFCGNPAVIVPDAAGLSDAHMQALAAELRMEAGFVLPPVQAGADLRMRFFSPGQEVDVSGHVTVATYAALRESGDVPGREAGEGARRVRQESRAGVLDVELSGWSEGAPWVSLELGRPGFGPALERAEVAEALRLAPAALAQGPAPRVVVCGVPLSVAALDGQTLTQVAPDMVKLSALSRRRGVLGIALYARPGVHPTSALTARFFFPAVGPDEDIVSGAALGAICAYAVRERQLACLGEATFQTDQGHSLGRPNRAQVVVRAEAGQIAGIRVSGRGVVVATGELRP